MKAICCAACAPSIPAPAIRHKKQMKSPADLIRPGQTLTLAGVADGAEGFVLADVLRGLAAKGTATLSVVCRDGARMAALARALAFFAPDVEVLTFPAWDCLPYDRVSPHPSVVAERMATLSRLARDSRRERPVAVLTSINAALQRVPPRNLVVGQSLHAAPG